ncbi:MAG TPA: Asp-tRNA(Asn)/Glu-tRNA(Gln) amidotransferase subunit GatC [Coriobacteriia bacterium]|jgi:aspartyl-tRNA(Asn)/glutamyl-tRNA(Gln) amidotransferase subunit C
MAISEEQVRHVALLARLSLSDDQVGVLAGQLSTILDHIETIKELDLADVPATAHAVSVTNAVRPDAIVPGLTQEQALRNAPKQRDGCFVIPRIVGAEGDENA